MSFKVKKGALHNELHIKQGKKIPLSTEEKDLSKAKREHDKKLEKRLIFAINARHFHHNVNPTKK